MKKEDLFRTGNVAKWEITPEEIKTINKEMLKNKDYAFSKMMGKETNHVNYLKQNYAFYTYQLFSEYERIKKLNSSIHSKHFVQLSEKHTDILTDVRYFVNILVTCYVGGFVILLFRLL